MHFLFAVVAILFVFTAGYFSAAETAILAANRMRLRLRAEAGDKAAAAIFKLLREPDRLITTILFGNNVALVAATTLLTLVAKEYAGELEAVIIGAVATTVLLTFFAEIIPKAVTLRDPDFFAASFAPAIAFFERLFRPAAAAASFISAGALGRARRSRNVPVVSREELRAILAERWGRSRNERLLHRMVKKTFYFGETTAAAVMTPIENVSAVRRDCDRDDVVAAVAASGFSKFPVYEGRATNVVGLVLAKDFLNPRARRADQYVRKTLDVNAADSVENILARLATRTVDMAVVRDEKGEALGILTQEDILEEIVGEIRDEYDWGALRPGRFGAGFLINGQIRISTFNRRVPYAIAVSTPQTLGDFIRNAAGKKLNVGDEVVSGPYRFKVLRMAGAVPRLIRVDVRPGGYKAVA